VTRSDISERKIHWKWAIISGWWLTIHLEKYESMGRIIPYIMEKNMFETTNGVGMTFFF
jgi:hypothetical protein